MFALRWYALDKQLANDNNSQAATSSVRHNHADTHRYNCQECPRTMCALHSVIANAPDSVQRIKFRGQR